MHKTTEKPKQAHEVLSVLPQRYCLTTITCDQFAIGTEVLLFSFLKHNSWFEGDITIVVETLSDEYRARLLALYPVKFIAASAELKAKVDVLRTHFQHLKDIHLRFYSLEAFNQPLYDKVVYVDSDMYCAGDVKAIFCVDDAVEEPLQACLDGFSYEERIAPLVADAGLNLPTSARRYGKEFDNSFNAGLIAIEPAKLPPTQFSRLVSMLEYDAWLSYGSSIFTDQMVINRCFEGQISVVSSEYNYMIFLENYLNYVDQVQPLQARIIHFAGKIKPWFVYDNHDLLNHAPHYLPYINQWRVLLDEARHHNDPSYRANKVLEQFEWIEGGADHCLNSIDRLY